MSTMADNLRTMLSARKRSDKARRFSIHGMVKSGYEAVREEFAKGFKMGLESKAQLCVYVGGEKVVDIW